MGAYLIRRILLIFPTLFGIMLINFAVIQIVPGGPVEQMIAQMTGTAVESTARFSGGGEGELDSNFDASNFEDSDSKYRELYNHPFCNASSSKITSRVDTFSSIYFHYIINL